MSSSIFSIGWPLPVRELKNTCLIVSVLISLIIDSISSRWPNRRGSVACCVVWYCDSTYCVWSCILSTMCADVSIRFRQPAEKWWPYWNTVLPQLNIHTSLIYTCKYIKIAYNMVHKCTIFIPSYNYEHQLWRFFSVFCQKVFNICYWCFKPCESKNVQIQQLHDILLQWSKSPG